MSERDDLFQGDPEAELNKRIDNQKTPVPQDFQYQVHAGNLSPRQMRELCEEYQVKFYQEGVTAFLQLRAAKAKAENRFDISDSTDYFSLRTKDDSLELRVVDKPAGAKVKAELIIVRKDGSFRTAGTEERDAK